MGGDEKSTSVLVLPEGMEAGYKHNLPAYGGRDAGWRVIHLRGKGE